jgi:hypothetical protein
MLPVRDLMQKNLTVYSMSLAGVPHSTASERRPTSPRGPRCLAASTLARRLHALARGLAPRSVLEKFADVGLNARLELVKDGPDRQVAPCLRGGRLLRFLPRRRHIGDARGATYGRDSRQLA